MYYAHAILIELLIVVAILGILAAVISTFMNTGRLNTARTEAENVKTAALAYYADHNTDAVVGWPATSIDLSSVNYTSGTLKGTYTFDGNGKITLAGTCYPGSIFTWSFAGQTWNKGL
jgi:Tfp pilus assembly protein PilE